MLNRDQIELIHREIDGANTSQESAAFRSLMEEDAEARALEADLRNVTQLFDRAGEREPPPRLKQAILEALPQAAPANGKVAIVTGLGTLLKAYTQSPVFRKRYTESWDANKPKPADPPKSGADVNQDMDNSIKEMEESIKTMPPATPRSSRAVPRPRCSPALRWRLAAAPPAS